MNFHNYPSSKEGREIIYFCLLAHQSLWLVSFFGRLGLGPSPLFRFFVSPLVLFFVSPGGSDFSDPFFLLK